MPDITSEEKAKWTAACKAVEVEYLESIVWDFDPRRFVNIAREAMPRLLARVEELEAGLTDLINDTGKLISYDPRLARHAIRTRCHQILQGPKQETPNDGP